MATIPTGTLHDERGVAAVEFGLIAGLLFLILFGILAFGETYSRLQVYEGAAREGARLASVKEPDPNAIAQRVEDAADPYNVNLSDFEILVGTPGTPGLCTDSTHGQRVEVTWEQDFDIELPFVPSLDFDKVISGVFRCE